jgi:glutamate racemase
VSTSDPIGVFDSGVGGLSVLRAIRRELPDENLIYVADSGHAPYGDRPPAFIEARATTIVHSLVRSRAKAIVVACNTATGVAVKKLRATFEQPIVAIEPAVKPAIARTRTGVVGVMATSVTLSSTNVKMLVETYGVGVRVVMQACPGLVELVEKGELSTDTTRALVERYLRPLLDEGADTIVLGCTHYPFLTPVISSIAGSEVSIVDPADSVARQLRRRLTERGLLAAGHEPAAEQFLTTGSCEITQSVIAQLWGRPVAVASLQED